MTMFDAPALPSVPGQMDLLSGDVPPPHQHGSATSAAAADQIASSAATLREQILSLLRGHGPMTDEQMQDALNMAGDTQRPRRRELEKAGLIFKQSTGTTRSGRSAQVWAAIPESAIA